MAKSRPTISSSRLPPASNNGESKELDSLSNSELIYFLESSFRRSEFIRVAGILKSRDELAKGEALNDLSAKLSLIKTKIDSLEIHAQEKIRVLTEEIEKERANSLRLEEQLKLEKANTETIAEIDSWKSKYSLLEAWILRFLDNNPHLIQKVRKQELNGGNQNMDFFRTNKTAAEWFRSNAASEKKKSFLAARVKSKAVIDISSNDIELVDDSFEDKSSVTKSSFGINDKNCRKRKFQIAQTSGVKGDIESDDEDDVVCISESMFKRFAEGIK